MTKRTRVLTPMAMANVKVKVYDYKEAQKRAKLAQATARVLHDSNKLGTFDAKIRKFKRAYRTNGLPGYELIQEFKDRAWAK